MKISYALLVYNFEVKMICVIIHNNCDLDLLLYNWVVFNTKKWRYSNELFSLIFMAYMVKNNIY